jgi:hypothetical protein
MTAWIIAMWLSMPVALVALYYLVELMFWCFCWCFCTVDNYLQERHWSRLKNDMRKIPSDEPAYRKAV